MLKFDESQLKEALVPVSHKKLLAFALLIFERMLTGLLSFSKETVFDSSIYLDARTEAWRVLSGQVGNNRWRSSFSDKLKESAPDTEHFSNPLVSHALNTAMAIDSIMEFLSDDHIDHIVEVASFARDSVDLYLSVLEPSRVTSKAIQESRAAHPLMQQELKRQADDLKFLSELPTDLNNRLIGLIRQRAENQPSLLRAGDSAA